MQSSEIRSRFLAFFEKRGHAIIPSASLVPENDPSVLFNTAGMQPLVPYLLGQEHPMGRRIADVQKCVRTGDLEDIGDNRHFSFFEMMGNWSLGDYFKKEAISWSYEFLTSKEEGLGLDVNRLYVTIFEGDENAPYDQESKEIWMSLGIPEHRIYALPADDNWWSPGDNGPCGPCSEMFYDMTGTTGDLDKDAFIAACKSEDVIEIWNDVFMEYEKKDGKVIGKLAQKNVDTGAGLERITAVMQGKKTAYETDLFEEVMDLIVNVRKNFSYGKVTYENIKNPEKYNRIFSDHLRTALFMIADGVIPYKNGKGYVLRKLLRRIMSDFSIHHFYEQVFILFEKKYKDFYPNLNAKEASKVFQLEFKQYSDTFANATNEFIKQYVRKNSDNIQTITGFDAFNFCSTQGIMKEVFIDLFQTNDLSQANYVLSSNFNDEYEKAFESHQKLSQSASAGMFKGGLANTNDKTVRLHTAHHLLLAALQQVVSPSIKQRGSNITEERLRMDFSFDRKLTDEEKKQVEDLVNEKIQEDLSVIRREMPLAEAEKIGAEMEFGAKYPDVVSVYFIEDKAGNHVSKEFCGGPHVTHTGELGQFKIQKEEAVAQGIRRIKAILE